MRHGFIKVAAITPKISVADCEYNLSNILSDISVAEDMGAKVVVLPELCVCGATCADLFFNRALTNACEDALSLLLKKTKSSDTVIIIGFPLVVNDNLYNSAVFCQNGHILGVIPKTILNNIERRYFSSYNGAVKNITLAEQTVPFGKELIFACTSVPSLRISAEVGDEATSPIAPSCAACAAGATLIASPFAAPELIESERYKKLTFSSLSARNTAAYVHASAGDGESTTDGVFAGSHLIYENGKLLAQRKPFGNEADNITVTEIDVDMLSSERRKKGSFATGSAEYTAIPFELKISETSLTRNIPSSPFIPQTTEELAERCDTILTIQSKGLAQRMTKARSTSLVIGISGGLDSCLAILVAARTMDILGMPRKNIIGVTMPCFGTTKRTKNNAEILCAELGATLKCVNIGAAVRQHFSDIGHSEENYNVVYENAQARERTQVIMDIANMENGLVVGTGDLSELALGWATYNGDHMSMYGVNGGVPKTLIRHIVAYCASEAQADGKAKLAAVLRDILDTPVSPELLPADKDGNIAQKTEDLVGPYEIHDFYIYYMLRYGFAPDKLFRLAKAALGEKYDGETLKKWLRNLCVRFFAQQFKRSCLPDGPKIGTVGVSPRGDLLCPSDASSAEWIKIIDTLK